jgi:MFS family permease
MLLLVEYIRQIGRFQRNARLYLISNALSGVAFGVILVLYNLYLVSLGYSTDFIGLMLFVGTVGGGLAIFPAGICIDRLGGKVIQIGASLLIGFVGIGQMLFRTPDLLLISGFFAGIGGAFFLVVNAPFLSANSTPAERPQLFSLNIVVTLSTSVLGEALGGVLPIWFRATSWLMSPLPPGYEWMLASQPITRSYQLALLFSGVIATPSLLPLFLMHSDRPQRADNTTFGNLHILSRQEMLQTLKMWRQQNYLYKVLLSPMLGMVGFQGLTALGAGLFIPYFNVYFVQHLGASSALFGLIDGGANLLNALLALLAPWLALRFGKIATMTLTRLLSIPLMLTIGLIGYLPVAALLYPLRQGLMDMSQGIAQVFSMEIVSKQHRGLANSSYQATYQGASALGAPVGGLIIARMGYTPVFLIAAVLYCLAIALLWGRFGLGGGKERQNEEPQLTNNDVGIVSR